MSGVKLEQYGALVVSWDFSNGSDVGVLVVGKQKNKGVIEVINAFQGKDAVELFERLTTQKKKEEPVL